MAVLLSFDWCKNGRAKPLLGQIWTLWPEAYSRIQNDLGLNPLFKKTFIDAFHVSP
jgi:hypothetical protein